MIIDVMLRLCNPCILRDQVFYTLYQHVQLKRPDIKGREASTTSRYLKMVLVNLLMVSYFQTLLIDVMSINIVVICSIHTNIELLPHFISHYKSLGVTKFILGIWQGDRNPIWKEISEYNDDTIQLVKSYDNQLNEPEDTKFAETVRRN